MFSFFVVIACAFACVISYKEDRKTFWFFLVVGIALLMSTIYIGGALT